MGASQNVPVLADNDAASRSAGNLRAEPKVVYRHFFCGDGHYRWADHLGCFYRWRYIALRIRRCNFLEDNFFFQL